jgi:hypothetical protein
LSLLLVVLVVALVVVVVGLVVVIALADLLGPLVYLLIAKD